jgi:flagellar biosynthesis GTPase FlhF
MSTSTYDTPATAPRVYQGRSVEELIPKIQAELGEDAIVLRRRKGLTGGIGGFFQRPFVEIEAQAGHPRLDVYDEQVDSPAPPPAAEQVDTLQPTPLGSSGFGGTYVTDALAALAAAGSHDAISPRLGAFANDDRAVSLAEEFHELTPASLLTPQPTLAGPDSPPTSHSTQSPPQRSARPAADPFAAALAAAEVAAGQAAAGDLREAPHPAPAAAVSAPPLEPQSPEPPAGETAALEPHPQASQPLVSQPLVSQPLVSQPLAAVPSRPLAAVPIPQGRARASIESSLLDRGIDEELARELIEAAAAHLLPLMAPRTSLMKAVHLALRQRIPVCPPLPAQSATVAFVGPGGSGKTACCAALLGAYRKRSTLPAACATILAGTAAGELAMLLSPHLLEPTPITDPRAVRALHETREQGLLLLDMPPLSSADRGSIRALAALLGTLQPSRVVLTLPATLGAKPAAQLLEALRPLRASALAITHADETDQLGVAVQAACRFGLAPEYLLDCGNARGGFLQIDPTYLADRLLP